MMDLDYARRRIQEAQDVVPLSDVLLEVIDTLGTFDDLLARQRQRIEELERQARAGYQEHRS